MRLLRQSTAQTIKMGPALDSTDGDTEETALTIAQADIRVSKDGGAFAQTNNTAGATHDENGFYDVPLDATDTNTLGELIVYVHVSGALYLKDIFQVVPAHVYDGLVLGTDFLQVDAQQVGGATPDTAADTADALLNRNIAGGSDGGRTVTEALRPLRNRITVSGGTLTVYEEDDATSSWTAAVSRAVADNISEIDPA